MNVSKPDTRFPEGFLWGVATAAYQIEGATNVDGRGKSIWDVFVRNGGSHNGDTPDIAADFYHRYPDDLRLLRETYGLKGLRFSIAWPRIVPDGSGPVCAAGLDHYDRMVDAMIALDISPLCTLYHWDLPQALQEKGGWLNRDTAQRFADYAIKVTERLGDRVKQFVTLNEPWSAAFMGHAQGLHAPGMRDYASAGTAAHHLLLAHGLALEAIRAQNRPLDIGVTLWLNSIEPFSQRPDDIDAANLADAESNRLWLDALLKGRYPERLIAVLPQLANEQTVQAGDLSRISQPLDFLGLNYYVKEMVAADRSVPITGFRRMPVPGPRNYRGDTLHPEGVEEILTRPLLDYGCTLPGLLHRGRQRLRRPCRPERPRARSAADRVPRPGLPGHSPRDRQGRGRARRLRMDFSRRFRMGRRLQRALWDYLRRLSHPAAHPKG